MPTLKEVFVPGGMPSYTYQDRKELNLESSLMGAILRLRKFIAVAGPTKSGKTVLVRRIVSKEHGIWVEGAHIATAEDFWQAVLMQLGVPLPGSSTNSRSLESSTDSETGLGVKPFGIGLEHKGKSQERTSTTQSFSKSPISYLPQLAIEALLRAQKTVVIDDFHYINADVQTALIRGLKQAVFDGLSVVLLLIPHRMHQAATAEMDVDGRTHTISIPVWQPKELFAIAETGARELQIRFHGRTIETLVGESFESPHLMQDFCSLMCADYGVLQTNSGALRTLDFIQGKEEFFRRFSETISPETFKALQKGPERTNRIERPLRSGGVCDTYEAILLALQNLDVMTPVRWGDLRRSLQTILIDEPQQHEVTRVLEKMDEIAKSRGGEPVLDYSKDQRELHLVDPFFRFYVRWGALVAK